MAQVRGDTPARRGWSFGPVRGTRCPGEGSGHGRGWEDSAIPGLARRSWRDTHDRSAAKASTEARGLPVSTDVQEDTNLPTKGASTEPRPGDGIGRLDEAVQSHSSANHHHHHRGSRAHHNAQGTDHHSALSALCRD